jgi:hypothetical protein
MLSFTIKVNDLSVVEGSAVQTEEVPGTETWRKYAWRILEGLPEAGQTVPFTGTKYGTIEHDRNDGAGILVAKILEAAYGKDTV